MTVRNYVFVFGVTALRDDRSLLGGSNIQQGCGAAVVSATAYADEELALMDATRWIHNHVRTVTYPERAGWYNHLLSTGVRVNDSVILAAADSIRALEE